MAEKQYVFHKYIVKVIDRYDDGLISDEELEQHLRTLNRWEGVFKKLPIAKRKKLLLEMSEEDK